MPLAREPCAPFFLITNNITEEREMTEQIDIARRQWVSTAALGLAAGTFAQIRSAASQSPGHISAQIIPAITPSSGTSFGALKHIDAGDLSIAYVDAGPAAGKPVLLLHGWPYDIYSFVDVAPALVAAGYRVLIPYLRGYGTTRFLLETTPRNGQQAALAADALNFLDALKIDKALIGGFDWGGRTACILAALWPERCTGLVAVSGYTISSQETQAKPLPPKSERAWWYLFYFATERGREGYAHYTHDFVRLTWELASPKWQFDDATFERSAPSFENPDHVAVSIHSYRWRLKLADGEAKYDEIEKQLAAYPTIGVPTITMEGDANEALHPEPASYAKKFTGPYEHRLISGGVGHNLPQEAPQAFAQAVVDVDNF
jgi:pimeloyl-ACP methyl ester carboxylesterase